MGIHRAAEDHHHTADAVQAYAWEARRIADELGLSDVDRAALLPGMLTLLASKQVWYQEVAPMPAMAIPRNKQF